MSSKNGGAVAVNKPRLSHSSGLGSGSGRPISFWIGAWWPVALGIAVVVLESTPQFGSNRTSDPLRWLWEHLFGMVDNVRWEVIHHIIRKCGHFVVYGLIGLAWLRAWRLSLPRLRFLTDAELAVLGTGLLASWDEWHQSFLPNRTSSPWDVLLDCCGAAAMCLAMYFYWRLARPERLARS